MRQGLTVLVPCKNELHNIRPCLESVRQIADEILVADSGSTDGTLDAVHAMGGCRIIEREYVNSAHFKNWAIPQAKHPWVFILDADERVPAALAGEIAQVVADPPEHLDAYSCAFQDFFMGHPLRFARWDSRSIRLIRRDVCRYSTRRVHADIVVDRRRVGQLKSRVLHHSFRDYNEFIHKYARYTTWASDDLWDKGRRASFGSLTLRPLFRFIHTYFLRGGFLDGLPGLQVCLFFAFCSTYMKQAKLWQKQHRLLQSEADVEPARPSILRYPEAAPLPPPCEAGSAKTPGVWQYRRAG